MLKHLCESFLFYSFLQRGSHPGAGIYQPFFSLQAGLFLILLRRVRMVDYKETPPPAGDNREQSRIIHLNLCGATGEEDGRRVGGCGPGSPLCGSAKGGSGGSGLPRLPTGPGCASPRPLPHQGGLQPDGYVSFDEAQSRRSHCQSCWKSFCFLRSAVFTTDNKSARLRETNFTVFFINCNSQVL